MTPPAYRCVECAQPAPQGQLLCAACEARAATRKQPFGQPPTVPPPPIAPQAYDLSNGAPPYQPNTEPPVNINIPSPPPAQPPFNLQGGGPASTPSYQPNTVPPPPMPGWQRQPDPSTDPNVLLQQLKQAEGSKPISARRLTFVERLGLRMAVRFGLAIVVGLAALIARLGHNAGKQTTSNDYSPAEMTRSSGYTRSAPANNVLYNSNTVSGARSAMNTVTPFVIQADDSSLGAALSRINAAWEDAKLMMDQAQLKLETSAGRADVSMFARQLEQDRQVIERNTPDRPIQIHLDCQRMARAIAEAEAMLSSAGEPQRLPASPPNVMGGQPVAPSSPNAPDSSDSPSPASGGNPPQSPGQSNPSEPQNQTPAGNNSSAIPAGAPAAPSTIPGSSETVPGQPNGNPSPPPASGGNGGQ